MFKKVWDSHTQICVGSKLLSVVMFNSSCNEQEHFELDKVAQSPIQSDLECFQVYHHLSRQPVSMF